MARVVGTGTTSVIVPIADAGVPISYPVPETRVTITVSSGSGLMVSAVGSTLRIAVEELAAKVTLVGIVV